MNSFLKICLGFAIGVVCTYVALSPETDSGLTGENRGESLPVAAETVEVATGNGETDAVSEASSVLTFDLKTEKGPVTLSIGMSKEEVKKLMGPPESTRINSYGSRICEHWEYDIRVRGVHVTDIDFVNGKLDSASQL